MAGHYLRGAFISFAPTRFAVPVPNVIVFQYNPESMTHAWTQPDADARFGNPMAVKGDPQESFTFTISMDALDTIADGGIAAAGLATASGVYSRLAAIELLQFPVDAPNATDPANGSTVPQLQAPTVLLVWGAGRIVPVRVTSLSITEKLYDELLNPVQAEASITVRVVTSDEMKKLIGPLKEIATTAYEYNKALRQGLAVANLANAAEGAIGMIPF